MKLDTIYLIHHSHTDIGYTADQPIFWDLQHRFLKDALDLIDRYRGGTESGDQDSAFRWTVETTCQIEAFLKTASRRDIDRLVRAESEGFVEVTAMFANLTPLADARQLIESLRPALRLRSEYGFDIRYAMNCDVNGHNWILPDILMDHGIAGFSMAINQHFGGAPRPRPEVFLWEAPSGRKLPTLNGWQYSKAYDFGLGDEDDGKFQSLLPDIERHLEDGGIKLPFMLLQGFHPFGDNGTAWDAYARFARRWNAAGRLPRIVCATPRTFWKRVLECGAQLPTKRGDWTDYWNFGSISTARETSVSRSSRERLVRADSLMAALAGFPSGNEEDSARRSARLYRDSAWRELNLYAEHTWGGDEAANRPETEDSLSMENHKKQTVWKARSLSLLLERDALAELARRVERNDPTDFILYNHLPWARLVSGTIGRNCIMPRGSLEDETASRHFQGRNEQPMDFWTGRENTSYNGNFGAILPPVELPPFGWAVVSASSLEFMVQAEPSEDLTVNTDRFRLSFEPTSGALLSIFDKQANRELVDADAGLPFHGFVHEEVADREREEPRKAIFEPEDSPLVKEWRGWRTDWKARRSSECRLVLHKAYRLPFETIIEQVLEHPKAGTIRRRIVLPDFSHRVEFHAEWLMGTDTHPQASYLAFPFSLSDAQARFDSGPAAVRPEIDQLPLTCRDYFTAQGWVDFNDGKRGIAIATPDNPMIQLGGFHFGHDQSRFELERPLLLGWVTNNYWETNFPGRQPGIVVSRYAILPYEGDFEEDRVRRFALEFANSRPVPQLLGEKRVGDYSLPATGTFLELPGRPFAIIGLKPSAEGEVELDIYNSSDDTARARIGSGLLAISSAIRLSFDGRGEPKALPVVNGEVTLEIEAKRFARLALRTAPTEQGENT